MYYESFQCTSYFHFTEGKIEDHKQHVTGVGTRDQIHMTTPYGQYSAWFLALNNSGIAVFGIYLARSAALSTILQQRHNYCTVLVAESFSCSETVVYKAC